MHKPLSLALLLALSAAAHIGQVMAHGEGQQEAGPVLKEQTAWGIAGDAEQVSRTVEIRMNDQMRFVPDRLEVRQGETLRLVHHNDGQVMHEFVLGTQKELDEHAELMIRFPDMEHDAPIWPMSGRGSAGRLSGPSTVPVNSTLPA